MEPDTDSVHGDEHEILEPTPHRPKSKKVHKFPGFWKTDPVDSPMFGHSRHDFQGPLKFQNPNPGDLVYWEARKVVEQYQQEEPFEKFANELFLSALNCAPTVLFSHYETAPVVHALFREGMVAKIQLKLVCDLEMGWSFCTVLVRDDDRWIPLRDLLKTLPDSTVETTGQVGHWIQHRWWQSMGKPFRLLDLPKEIQQQVLLYALGEEVLPQFAWPRSNNVLSITRGTGPKMRPYRGMTSIEWPNPRRVLPTNLSVLRLNKDLAAIATQILWRDTTKVFIENYLESLREVCTPTILISNHFMRRMHLILSPMELVDLFHVHIQPFNQGFAEEWWVDAVEMHCIKSLPNLSFLEIEFPEKEYNSPWLDSNRRGLEFDEGQDGFDQLRAPCHQVFVDMIMSFAAPYLQHVKTVRLSGRVLEFSKKKWEQILSKTCFSENKDLIETWKKEFAALGPRDL